MNRRELAAAYLLEDLDGPGRAEVERRLAEDAELRSEVEAIRPLLAHLGSLPEEAWPDTTAAAQAPRASAPRRWSIRPAVALCALLLVAALGIGAGVLLDGGGGSAQSEPAIVLRPLEPTAGEQATVAMPSAGEMLLRAEGLPALGANQYYELWLMSDAERLVPVASFRVGADGTALVRVPLPADPAAYRYFDISRQDVGAGTGHSAVSVLRGPTS